MVLLASPVALDPLDLKDQLDQSDLLADLAAMASPEALVLKAKLEHQVSPEAQAKMDSPAHQADSLAQLALKDPKDPLALMALQAKMVSPAAPVLQEKTDSPADLASQVLLKTNFKKLRTTLNNTGT